MNEQRRAKHLREFMATQHHDFGSDNGTPQRETTIKDGLDVPQAQALLASAQALRTQWSGMIVQMMNFAILTNVALWSLLIPQYLSQYQRTLTWDHSYVAFSSTISVILLLFWRWYAYYLDANIAGLYPELITYEGRLSCAPESGMSGYLARGCGKKAGDYFVKLPYEKRAVTVRKLIKQNLIGSRGHLVIDSLVLALMLFLNVGVVFGLGIFGFWKIGYVAPERGFVRLGLKWAAGILSAGSVILMIVLMAKHPRRPRERQLRAIAESLEEALQIGLRSDNRGPPNTIDAGDE